MGYKLEDEALSAAHGCSRIEGRPLSNRAWRVLILMAHDALDQPGRRAPAREYFGGWERLAMAALNYPEWNRNNAANRAVARAISELMERKLIRVADIQNGSHTHYQILPPL